MASQKNPSQLNIKEYPDIKCELIAFWKQGAFRVLGAS